MEKRNVTLINCDYSSHFNCTINFYTMTFPNTKAVPLSMFHLDHLFCSYTINLKKQPLEGQGSIKINPRKVLELYKSGYLKKYPKL